MAGTPQSRNRLEDRRSEDDEVPRGMWKTVEASSREVRIEKTKGERSERRSKKKMREKGKAEKAEKRKDSGSKENSRGVGNMGGRRRSGKIRSRSKKFGARKFSQMDKGIWEELVRENADKETVESCNRH